jgi:hypothetical protein
MTRRGFQRIQNFFLLHPRSEDFLVAFLFATMVCFLTSCSLSPLYPLNNYDYMNVDSNLFRYEASLWLAGRTPYLDFYDHKGLYHVAVDALGLLIGGGSRYGIFALEILVSCLNLYFLARSVRLIEGNDWRYRLFADLFYGLLFAILAQGNSEGEWILPFTTLFVYFYLRGLVLERPSSFVWGSFFMGLSVGLALNSRPLDAIWGGMGAVYYVVQYARKKSKISALFANMGIAILGCLIPFAIIYPLAVQGGYLNTMFDAIFVTSSHYWVRHWSEFNGYAFTNRLLCVLAFVYALLGLREFRKKKFSGLAYDLGEYFLVMALGASVLYFFVAGYFHYFQSGFAFVILAFEYSLRLFPLKAEHQEKCRKRISLFMGVAITTFSCLYLIGYYTVGFFDFSYAHSEMILTSLEENVPDSAWQEGKVFAIDCDPSVYLDGNTVVQERYCAFTYWWNQDNSSVAKEVQEYLLSEKHPDYLLVGNADAALDHDYDAIIAAHYETLVAENSAFRIYRYVS